MERYEKPRVAAAWLVLAVLLLVLPSAGRSQAAPGDGARRIAFVVGINAYANLTADQQLLKAVNDADAIARTLGGLGYRVVHAVDPSRVELLRLWQEFLNAIAPGDEAAVYFAGHGVEIGGLNYLIPSDVPRVKAGDLDLLRGTAIGFETLLEGLRDRSPRVSLIILDACRDSPFQGPRGRSITRSRGLADVRPPKGTFIMFSAGAGQQAIDVFGDDDTAPNSIYVRELLPLLSTPGLEITEIARRVRQNVDALVNRAGHQQTPAYYDEIIGRFCPAGCAGRDTHASQPAPAHPAPAPQTSLAVLGQKVPQRAEPGVRSPVGAFDGIWLTTGKSTNCPQKSWTKRWTIREAVMMRPNGEVGGKVDANGRIELWLPSGVNPNVSVHYTGTMTGERGEGRYRSARCGGTFTMVREP